jgi:hypothetical protein
MHYPHHWWCLVLAGLLTPPLAAQEKWLTDEAVTLSPSKAPIPALKFRFFPIASERKPGNAAPIYLRFAHERGDRLKKELTETVDKALVLPLDKLPLAELKTFFARHRYNLHQMDLAARRQSCDWNYTLDVDDIIGLLLPDAQEMRKHGRLLAVKARVEIVEGKYAEAARTLETGFSFSQQVGGGPFLINNLVGVAIAQQLADCVLEFQQRPDAPDLYWPLTALPRPLVDQRSGLEFEQIVIEREFPDLADVERPRSPQEWDASLARVRKRWEKLFDILSAPPEKPGRQETRFPKELGRAESVPEAKKWLIEKRGLQADKVNAMPNSQVLLLVMAWQGREWHDEWFKAAYLPYPEARPILEDTHKRLQATPMTDGVAIPRAFLPALNKAMQAEARLERKLAALRIIAALRLHAASKGELPEKLEQVKEVPLPLDPITGKAFEYQRDGATAILSSRVPGDPPTLNGLRYRITLRK